MSPAAKDVALSFLRLASAGDVEEAFSGQFVSTDFTHHNPHFPADPDALARGMKESAERYPAKTLDVQHVLQDGDLVAVHSRVRLDPAEPEIAVVHLFRFEDTLICELWDVATPVPEDSPNDNGAF